MHDATVFAIRGDDLSDQLGAIHDVARDDGTVDSGRVQELASVVELDVARNLVSAHYVEPTGPEHLGDSRREIIVEWNVTWW